MVDLMEEDGDEGKEKRNDYSDSVYFWKNVKNRALKIQRIHFRGIGKYTQKVATVYTIQNYRGKRHENTGMEMFSDEKLYENRDNMLLAMKHNEIYVSKVHNLQGCGICIEPMWLDSGVEQNDSAVEDEVYTFF